MSALMIEEYERDAESMRDHPPPASPWYRRQERQTPKPTVDQLIARWRKLMDERQ